MNPRSDQFLTLVRNPYKFSLFLLQKLPAAYFSGLKLKEVSAEKCSISIQPNWFNKNPFRSVYFACLSMAAEMSTGVLAMMNLYGRQPAVSMLVIKTEAEYFKKVVGPVRFCCKDGENIQLAVEEAVVSHEAVTCRTKSIGVNPEGEVVAEFHITWSFKVKSA
jgi:hypothetical protein